MGVYIKGIDLPNSGQIELIIRPHGKVVVKTRGIGMVEAFQIPTPHGRLIDENELIWRFRESKACCDRPLETVGVAPTILEAEE